MSAQAGGTRGPGSRGSTLALYTLGAGNFVIGVGAFVVIGILSPVMQDLSLSKSGAGLLLTTYALA